MKELQELIYSMLTENTGTHMCDSGGTDGRMWQKNQKKTIEDFKKEDEATLELSLWQNKIEATVNISVFHYLSNNLELNDTCNEFNSMNCDDWNSEEFYGVSDDGELFLMSIIDELKEDSWNSYNWESSFSQVMQGRNFEINGEKYVLLQIHNGADVRGGYTDAKLFKISDNCEFFLSEHASFDVVDWYGEFINHDGQCATEEDWQKLKEKYKVTEEDSKIVKGSIH